MKLSALPIILIGLAVGIVALSYAYFHEYAVNTTQAQYYNENADALEAEAGKMGQAQKRVEQAKKMVREKEDAWSQVVATRTLPANLPGGGINLNQDAWHLVIDARKFRNNIQRAVNAQLLKGGVTVVNGPEVPYPSESATDILANYFNYPPMPFPVVRYDLGTVTVRGTYKQICDNVRAWKSMPHYLAVADGLAFTGTSPLLTGTYNLSIVGYIEVNGIYPAVPEGAGATAAATGGGNAARGGGQAGPRGPGAPPMMGSGMSGPPPGFNRGAGRGGGPG